MNKQKGSASWKVCLSHTTRT